MFAFRDEAGKPVYWIYNYKRGAFYPFVPAAGEQQRDNERELRLKAQIGTELPIEAELERWFPSGASRSKGSGFGFACQALASSRLRRRSSRESGPRR